MMRLVAHRGRFGTSPENAVAGLRTLPGPGYGVEVDVRRTRDGHLVLHHDPDLGRTTGGHGMIAELDLAEVRTQCLADGARVPTLEEYLEACEVAPASPILIDVKHDDPATLARVADITLAAAVRERCLVLVRSVEGAAQLRELTTELCLGLLRVTLADVETKIAGARAHGASMLFIHHGDDAYLANRQAVGTIRAAGLSPAASTLQRPDTLLAAHRDGCVLALVDALPSPSQGTELRGEWP